MRQSIDAGVIYRQLAPGRAFTSADDVKATLDLIKWYDYAIAKSDAIIGQMCMTFLLNDDDDKKADFFPIFFCCDPMRREKLISPWSSFEYYDKRSLGRNIFGDDDRKKEEFQLIWLTLRK